MRLLVDNLLQYARAGTMSSENFKSINLGQIIGTALKNLKAAIDENKALITIGDNVSIVSGDEIQLIQLFQNLIANCLKFRKPFEKPRIHIQMKDHTENFWVISIQDEGIGIDPKYSKKVFEIFGRLHGQTQYEGSGIGLAVCKKIVSLHGGEIWFESELGTGTTFYFTLPKMFQK